MTFIDLKSLNSRKNPFFHRNCLKSGIYRTGSENFKTENKAHDHKPNIHAPKNDIYGPKIA